MLRRGLHIAGRSLLKPAILVPLFVILLLIFTSLKKMNTSNGLKIFDIIRSFGFNEVLTTFVLSQAAHETAGFTSSLYRNDNNAFGMTFAGQSLAKQSTRSFIDSSGKKVFYANYGTINESVADFASWYSRHRNKILSLPITINSLKDYVRFLKNNNYFEAPESEYLAGSQRYYNLYFA